MAIAGLKMGDCTQVLLALSLMRRLPLHRGSQIQVPQLRQVLLHPSATASQASCICATPLALPLDRYVDRLCSRETMAVMAHPCLSSPRQAGTGAPHETSLFLRQRGQAYRTQHQAARQPPAQLTLLPAQALLPGRMLALIHLLQVTSIPQAQLVCDPDCVCCNIYKPSC